MLAIISLFCSATKERIGCAVLSSKRSIDSLDTAFPLGSPSAFCWTIRIVFLGHWKKLKPPFYLSFYSCSELRHSGGFNFFQCPYRFIVILLFARAFQWAANVRDHLPAVALATNLTEATSLNLPEKSATRCGSAWIALLSFDDELLYIIFLIFRFDLIPFNPHSFQWFFHVGNHIHIFG